MYKSGAPLLSGEILVFPRLQLKAATRQWHRRTGGLWGTMPSEFVLGPARNLLMFLNQSLCLFMHLDDSYPRNLCHFFDICWCLEPLNSCVYGQEFEPHLLEMPEALQNLSQLFPVPWQKRSSPAWGGRSLQACFSRQQHDSNGFFRGSFGGHDGTLPKLLGAGQVQYVKAVSFCLGSLPGLGDVWPCRFGEDPCPLQLGSTAVAGDVLSAVLIVAVAEVLSFCLIHF